MIAGAVDPAEDQRFMAIALALGRRGLGNVWPNPAVGAVVVQQGPGGPVVVGRGWTQPGGRPHAETEALRRAADAARGGTLYVSLEPCTHYGKTPPCVEAILAAGIGTVVSALEDPNPDVAGKGHERLRAAAITVRTGIGSTDAAQAHAGHIRRMREGRPHVTLKLAMSADGKAGLLGRRPVALTGERARDRVHRLRSMSDAIIVGIGTVLADDPLLTCRLSGMAKWSPVRVVLDARLRIPLDSRLVSTAAEVPVWLIAGESAPADREGQLRNRGAEIIRIATSTPDRIDLDAALRALAGRGITRAMLEGGPIVAASFLTEDCADEIVLFRSNNVVGPDGIEALEPGSLEALKNSGRFKSVETASIGPDRMEHLVRA
jgi:diaminohydroxyphosphoribosylaminopyrimidine deaminase / 5-amino-6-(5-phosphoribosylamino)uracil reductase